MNDTDLPTPEDLAASMHAATSTMPDAHAKYIELGKRFGVGPFTVQTNPFWLERAARKDVDTQALIASHPATAKYLSDPNHAAISIDEIENLKRLEDIIGESGEIEQTGLIRDSYRKSIADYLRERGREVLEPDQPSQGIKLPPYAQRMAEQAAATAGAEAGLTPEEMGLSKDGKAPASSVVELPTGDKGVAETFFRDTGEGRSVPFANVAPDALLVADLNSLAEKMKAKKMEDEDWVKLLEYDNEMRRGTTFGGQVASLLVRMPAFAGEFLATGGLYTAGKTAARNTGLFAAKRLLNMTVREAVENSIMRVGIKTAGVVAGSAVQATVGMPHLIAVDVMRRQVPQFAGMSASEEGELDQIIADPKDGFGMSVVKAMTRQNIEVLSERTGGAITKVLDSVPGVTALKSAIAARWFKLNPTSGVSQYMALLRKGGYDGPLEEVGEEFVADAMNAIIPWMESPDINSQKYWQEKLAALVGFSLLPAAGLAFSTPSMIRYSQQQANRAQAQQDWFRSLGTQSVESKTRELVPGFLGALGDIAAQNGPVETLFAPRAQWDSYWTSKGMDPRAMAADLMGSAEAYDRSKEAGDTGADLEIPLGAYVEKIAPTEHNDGIAQTLRIGSADAMNVLEMRAAAAAVEQATQQALTLNQDITNLTTEQGSLSEELAGIQERLAALQAGEGERSARMQAIAEQLQASTPEALTAMLSGGEVSPELAATVQEYQSLVQQAQEATQAQERVTAITTRQQEIEQALTALREQESAARNSSPENVREVAEMATEVFDSLVATGNVSQRTARVQANMFARMAWIAGMRGGESLQQFREAFKVTIQGGANDNQATNATTLNKLTRDGGGGYSAGSLAPLEGAPTVAGASGPDANLVAVAEQYARDNGIQLRRQARYVDVDPERAERIAQAYADMEHAPNDPAVREAYENLARQTMAQYRALADAGYVFYLMDETNDPYQGNPWNAMRDLRANKRMGVFATEAGFGSGATDIDVTSNPLLQDTGLQWGYGSPDGPMKRVLFNDLFRAVHDAFGHGLEGAGFRAQGEENAWQAHVRLFTGSAVGAITSETRGQNSWLNYGPYGEKNRNAKVEDTVFADQKTGLMPEWTWTEGVAPDEQSSTNLLQQEQQQRDADYLAAVEAGDMKTAQRLVDEAAEAAGFVTYKDYYHLGKKGIDELNRTQTFFITPDFDFTGTAYYNKVEKTYPLYIHSGMRLFDITDPQDASQLPLSDSERQAVENVKRWYSDEGEWNRLSDSEFGNLTEQQRNEHDDAYSSGDYSIVESYEEEIRALGYDGYYVRENGTRNIGVLNTSQVKSSEPVTRDADGNVIPLSERFNTERTNILYQTAPSEDVLADAPTITLQDLVGKFVFPIIADLTSAGQVYTGIDSTQIAVPIYTQGGPEFPLLPENVNAGVAWASHGKHIADSKAKRAGEKVLGVVVAMHKDAHASNATVVSAILSTIQAYIADGRITKENVAKLDEFIRTQGPIAERKAFAEASERLVKNIKKLENAEKAHAKKPTAKTAKKVQDAKDAVEKAQADKEDSSPGEKSLVNWPGFEQADQLVRFIDRNQTTFARRLRLADLLDLKEAQGLGLPNVQAIVNALRSPAYEGSRWGDALLVIEFEQDAPLVRLGSEGTTEHFSYEWGLRGKVVGKLARPVNYTLIWDEFFKERRAQHDRYLTELEAEAKRRKRTVDSLSKQEIKDINAMFEKRDKDLKPALPDGDRRSFELAKPVQEITPEIANRVPQTPYEAIRNPVHAQMVLSFLNDNWTTTDEAVNDGGLSPADFLDALAADPRKVLLDEYTLKSIAEAKKKKKLKLFKLKGGNLFFGVKNGDPASEYGQDPKKYGFGPSEKMLTLVLNGQANAPGMATAVMLKALEEGVTSLDCYSVPSKKYPKGFLPTLYRQYGFEVVGTIPFDPQYHSATKLADMEKLWKADGWDESQGYPPIALMKWKGQDEQRQGLRERYLRENTAGFLAGGTSLADTAAGKRSRLNARKGDEGAGVRPDGGRDTGVQGTAVRPSDNTSRLAEGWFELKAFTPAELKNLGLDPEAVKKIKEKYEDESVFPEVTLNQNAVDFRPDALTEAAQQLKSGKITRAEYNRIAAVELPLKPFDAVPAPATMDQVLYGVGDRKAGSRLKRDLAAKPEDIPAQTLEARLDIPAYREKGVWVVTLHEDRGDKSQGTAASPIAYTSTAVLDNVTFKIHESAALGIATGKPKGTIATMRGDYKPMAAGDAAALAEQAMREGWVQVGMNPLRHSYFYDKSDERPVTSADQVIQVGGMVLAKNPVYGDAEMYLFQNKVSRVGMTAAEIQEWAASHSIDEIRKKLESFRLTPTPAMLNMLGAYPGYLNPVIDFLMEQRQKLLAGKITPRDVAKAYWITVASIGSDAIGVDTIRAKADQIGVKFDPDPMFLSKGAQGQDTMRPEEMAAWWLSTPMGQRALNAIEKGEVDKQAWEQGLALRDAYGRNDARTQTLADGTYKQGILGIKPGKRKLNLNDILEITDSINATKGDSAKLEKVLSSIHNIANGKKGFIGHMVGMGDVATIDAVELNVWLTGQGDTSYASEEMKKRVALAKKGGNDVGAFFERIRSRIADLHKKTKKATGIPDDVAAHIIHHWIWDAAKGTQTTHAGVYEAMRFYQEGDKAQGSISFNPNERGTGRRKFTIRMLKKADASTFMHEAAHFFLEVYADLTARPGASEELQRDWALISKWLGLTAGTPITTEQHEAFARGFEKYLMEGKAPAEEVRGFFARMSRWLVGIYKDLRNLSVELSDDIRGVFDRMVAAETEIAAAEAREKVEPMFGQKPDSMTDEAWLKYKAVVERASLDARERLRKKLEREMLDARTEQREEQTARIREQVTKELAGMRAHATLAMLRFASTPDGEELQPPMVAFKLDRDSLNALGLPKEDLNKLRRLGVYRVEGGIPVESAAELLGYGSADELVRELITTPRFDDAVKEETKRRVDEAFPSLLTDGVEQEASEAVRSTHRTDVIAEEVDALRRAISRDEAAVRRITTLAPTPLGEIAKRVLRGSPEQAMAASVLLDNSKVTTDFYKLIALDAARNQLSGMKLRDIRPSLYLAAARNAGARASRLAAAGDFAGALGQKESELLNHLLYRESRRIQKEADKHQRYLRRMGETPARERLGKANPSYREQVDALLERFNFIPIPLTQVDRRAKFAAWIKKQEAAGVTLDIDERLRDEAFRKDFREMVADELRALYEAVKQIEHFATLTNKLLSAQQERTLREAVDTLVAQITSNTPASPERIGSRTDMDKVKEGWDGFFVAHRKLASVVREMDGFVDSGSVFNLLMKPINHASEMEAVAIEQATENLQNLFSVYSKEERKEMTRKRLVRGATRNYNFSHEDRLCIALNWGNEDNRKKLVDGYTGFTEADVLQILDTLTAKDWQFVQSVWDYINSFWPAIRDKEERVYGLAPDKVEASPINTKFGIFNGGYYPLKYTGAKASGRDDATVAAEMMRGAVGRSTTRRGHTEARQEGSGRPVRLEIGVLFDHVQQVVHDLTHHEMLIDVNRLLNNERVVAAIEQHYGVAKYKSILMAVQAVAVGNTKSEDFTMGLSRLRAGASVAGLGFNLVTSMMQAFGLTNAIPRVGALNMAKAVGRWIGSAKDMEDSIAWIYERSDVMRLRGKTMNRELNELRNTVDPKWQNGLTDAYFYLIQRGQVLADVPTWLAAYYKSVDAGMGEAEAVRVADQTVIDTQGGGQVKDLAEIQRGGPVLKLFTTFYSYFSALWNMNVETVKKTDFKSPADFGRMMVDLLILNTVPVVLQYLLLTALRGGSGDDEEWYKTLAKQQLSYLLGQLVFVREFGGIMEKRGYEGTAGTRFIPDTYKLYKETADGDFDRGFWVSLNKVAGILFHYPSVQLQRTFEGMKSLWEGKTQNPAVVVVGPTKEQR